MQRAVADGDRIRLRAGLEQARKIRAQIPHLQRTYLGESTDIVCIVPDKPGVIGQLGNILGSCQVNIMDLEILRIREGDGGTIRISVPDDDAALRAVEALSRQHIKAWRSEEVKVVEIKLSQCKALRGEIRVSADKSISHRTLIFFSPGPGQEQCTEFPSSPGHSVNLQMSRPMGVDIRTEKQSLIISGKGWEGLKEARMYWTAAIPEPLCASCPDCWRDFPFFQFLSGDRSLRQRPMRRVMEPLRMMGATLYARQNGLAPLVVIGGSLAGIEYQLPVASAQLKTALLLAGLQAEGKPSCGKCSLPGITANECCPPWEPTHCEAGERHPHPGKTLEPQQFLVPGISLQRLFSWWQLPLCRVGAYDPRRRRQSYQGGVIEVLGRHGSRYNHGEPQNGGG